MSSFNAVPCKDLKNKFGLTGFIETGTGEGGLAVEMASIAGFEKIASCEIDKDWAKTAAQLFVNDPDICIFRDCSKNSLPLMFKFVGNHNTLFWLDAHFPQKSELYSDEIIFPLRDEVRIISQKQGIENDVICIDDLRLFDLSIRPEQWNYPVLITRDQIEDLFPNHEAFVIDVPDVILVLQPKGKR